jgi:hypothetical protein
MAADATDVMHHRGGTRQLDRSPAGGGEHSFLLGMVGSPITTSTQAARKSPARLCDSAFLHSQLGGGS